MSRLPPVGVLDTCTNIDLLVLEPKDLPGRWESTAISLAELHQSVGMASAAQLARRF